MIHGRKQGGHETVAGADRVDDVDVWGRYLDPLSVENGERPAFAESCHAEAGTQRRPRRKAILHRSAGIEPLEVFLACFDDGRKSNLPLNQSYDAFAIRRC